MCCSSSLDNVPWVTSAATNKMAQDTMSPMGLSQLISGPTHLAVHTLHLVFCSVNGDLNVVDGVIQ